MLSPNGRTGLGWKRARPVLIDAIHTGLFVLILLISFSTTSHAQQRLATVTGLITDQLDGSFLQGATVYVSQPGTVGILKGTITDSNGRYTLSQIRPGKYELIIRFVGYDEEKVLINLSPGQLLTRDASLQQSRIDLNTIVVSASRQEEKVLDAISSVSVINDFEIQPEATLSPSSTLRHIAGVEYAQTGIDRREISLRGFNNSVTGETYVLTDHRLSAVPGLAINAYGLMPIPTLDISRIEVVRGPGSALYGSGVDQGLIHFITKNPFSFPGTSVSTGAGERGLFETEFRHAGIVNNQLGYKIVGEFAMGDDWELSQSNSEDAALIQENDNTLRDPDYWKYGLNAWVEYRFNSDTKLIANGGYFSQKMALLTGIGAAQTDNFAYSFAQIRFQSGSFSSQIYLNQNDGGRSFYYNPTIISGSRFDIVDRTMLLNGQAQYDILAFNGRQEFLVGADYKLTLPKTEGTIHGRNESIDRIEEIGAYAQSTTILTEDVNLSLALRGDYNNLVEEVRFSPRAGLVFKITPQHTFRLSANQAYGAPVLNPNFLDLRLSNEPIDGPFTLALQGRGAHDGFTFNQFRESQTVTYLMPDIGDRGQPENPAFFGQNIPLDQLPIHPIYESFASGLSTALTDGLPLPDPLSRLSASERETFARLVQQLQPYVLGNTAGILGLPDASETGFREVNGPVDIEPLKQTITRSIEAGYKGLIGDWLVVSGDVYLTQKRNFIGPLTLESPFAYMANLEEDLAALISPIMEDFIEADPQLSALLQGMNLSTAEATAFIAELAANGYDHLPAYARTRVGVVQPDQDVLPDGQTPAVAGGLLTYRNFGNVSLWGTEIAVEYLAIDRLRVHANLSYISDDYFDSKELQEEGNDLAVALNAPTFKFGAGVEYNFPFGLSLRLSGRKVNDFVVISGPFIGTIDNYLVFDGGLGFDFGRQITGLRFDLSAHNVLTFVDGKMTDTHREFIGAPQIGRLVMARVLFTF